MLALFTKDNMVFVEAAAYNKNYALNLEAMSVFVSSGKSGETLCGRIQNTDNIYMTQREQKLICNRRIHGRYIRVQPEARAALSTPWYSAVICEIMAFTWVKPLPFFLNILSSICCLKWSAFTKTSFNKQHNVRWCKSHHAVGRWLIWRDTQNTSS